MVSEPGTVEGPRGAKPSEFGEVIDFLNFVFRSNVGRRPSMGGDYPHLYRESNAHNLRHIRVNGRISSSVSIYPARVQWGEAILKVGGIGGVATDPSYRKQGYAGMVLEDCLRVMESEGYDLSLLWTGIPDYYRRWGWENAGEVWKFFIDRSTITYLPSAPSGEVLTSPTDARAIDAVQKLHTEARRGVVRDRELTEIMMSTRTRHKIAVLLVNDNPFAYIIHSFGEQADVKDFGGDPEGVLGLMRIVFGREGARAMHILTPAEDAGIAQLLRQRGFQARPECVGMIALIDPLRIVKRYGIEDLVVAPDSGPGGGWNVTKGSQSVAYSRNEMVKFLFGPERPPGIQHPKLPLPFYYDWLDHM